MQRPNSSHSELVVQAQVPAISASMTIVFVQSLKYVTLFLERFPVRLRYPTRSRKGVRYIDLEAALLHRLATIRAIHKYTKTRIAFPPLWSFPRREPPSSSISGSSSAVEYACHSCDSTQHLAGPDDHRTSRSWLHFGRWGREPNRASESVGWQECGLREDLRSLPYLDTLTQQLTSVDQGSSLRVSFASPEHPAGC